VIDEMTLELNTPYFCSGICSRPHPIIYTFMTHSVVRTSLKQEVNREKWKWPASLSLPTTICGVVACVRD